MNYFKFLLSILMVAVIGFFSIAPAQAINLNDLFSKFGSQQPQFLAVDDAFKVTSKVQGKQLTVTFKAVKGHYVYRDKLTLVLPKGVTASKFRFDQTPTFIDDPKYGKVAVFSQPIITATTRLTNKSAKDLKNVALQIKWQGCAKAGICYPPQKITVRTTLKKSATAIKKKVKR